jgi:superfamily II DNA/RNA helicase
MNHLQDSLNYSAIFAGSTHIDIMNHQSILSAFNITALNDMQKAALEAIPKPNDVMLISPTGSGKTLAFLLPVVSLLKPDIQGIQVLILVPSRELAIQIESVFKQMGTGFKINSCYGGHSVRIEENNLQQAPAMLVGTPGRVAHHVSTELLKLETTHTLILDEFDKSLEAGFQDDMEFIIKQCTHLQKRILTSATALDEIPRFVGLKNSVSLNYTTQHKELASSLVVRSVQVEGDDKLEALMLLLGKTSNQGPVIVFCNHRDAVDRISEQLTIHKVAHGFYHGGLEQIDREKTLIKFRNGSSTILVSTDLAARGLDIPEVATVIHYQLPATEDVMIHRNGRTARMNAAGTAYFLLDTEDRLPQFITTPPPAESLPKKLVLPKPAEWQTLYISAGKKDKVNKMDVVGMLLQKGNLQKDELGRIDILDYSAYAAVRSYKIAQTLPLIKNEKIKNKKVKIEIAS